MFRLQEITAMKLKCISIEQAALETSLAKGHENEAIACRLEIERLKKEAMQPKMVLDSIQQYLGDSNV